MRAHGQVVVESLIAVVVLGLGVGSVAALAALGFVETVLWLNDLLFISPRSRVAIDASGWLLALTVAVPTLGGFLVGLICAAMTDRRPHGPADAILATHRDGAFLPARAGVLSALAAVLSLGVGAPVGQYGPLVHIGSTLGSWGAKWLGGRRYFATVGIGCGAAAAIATAFNAPVAGLVFAHEVILRHYSLRAFAPISVAATSGYVFSAVIFERAPLFRIESFDIGNPYEYLGFILIGVAGAAIAVAFMQLIFFSARNAKRLPIPGVLKPALAGMAVGLVAIELTDVLGIGKELLRFAVIDGAFRPSELALLLVAKMGLTALCLGFGFVGGVFSPAVIIGVLFGALSGLGAEWVFGPDRSPVAIYAICGMVAVTSPVIGAPLTSILIVFELTRNYDLATAAIASVAFANLLGYWWFGRSYFDRQLLGRGVDLTLGRDKVIIEQQVIGDWVSNAYTEVTATLSLAEVRQRLISGQRSEAYVVDEERHYLGTLSLQRIEQVLDSGAGCSELAVFYAKRETLTVAPDDSLWDVMIRLEDFIGESIPVIENQRLLGVVYEASIVRAYVETLGRIRREENAAS